MHTETQEHLYHPLFARILFCSLFVPVTRAHLLFSASHSRVQAPPLLLLLPEPVHQAAPVSVCVHVWRRFYAVLLSCVSLLFFPLFLTVALTALALFSPLTDADEGSRRRKVYGESG